MVPPSGQQYPWPRHPAVPAAEPADADRVWRTAAIGEAEVRQEVSMVVSSQVSHPPPPLDMAIAEPGPQEPIPRQPLVAQNDGLLFITATRSARGPLPPNLYPGQSQLQTTTAWPRHIQLPIRHYFRWPLRARRSLSDTDILTDRRFGLPLMAPGTAASNLGQLWWPEMGEPDWGMPIRDRVPRGLRHTWPNSGPESTRWP